MCGNYYYFRSMITSGDIVVWRGIITMYYYLKICGVPKDEVTLADTPDYKLWIKCTTA